MSEVIIQEADEPRLPAVQEPPLTGWLRVIDRMISAGTSPDILTRVFELQREADKEMQRKSFVEAFAAFKAEAPSSIKRTGQVKHGTNAGGTKEYDHVELDVAAAALTPFLSKHGLATSWEVSPPDDKGYLTVSCVLEHVAGHSRKVTLRAHADPSGGKNEHQAIGSGLYYLERYTYLAVLGIAQAGMDDDAEGTRELLSEEQVGEIGTLIQEKKADVTAFKKWLKTFAGTDQVHEVEAKHFEKITDMLRRKKS